MDQDACSTGVRPWLHLFCLEQIDGIKIEAVSFGPKSLIESAKEADPQPAPPFQLHRVGFATIEADLIDSF